MADFLLYLLVALGGVILLGQFLLWQRVGRSDDFTSRFERVENMLERVEQSV